MKLDSSSMDFGGASDIVLRKTESVQTTTSVLKKLSGVYEEHAKLVFCFDVSGSMSERVAADKNKVGFADQYAALTDGGHERYPSIRAMCRANFPKLFRGR